MTRILLGVLVLSLTVTFGTGFFLRRAWIANAEQATEILKLTSQREADALAAQRLLDAERKENRRLSEALAGLAEITDEVGVDYLSQPVPPSVQRLFP